MRVEVAILRRDVGKDPYWARYTLEAMPWDRVLDLLLTQNLHLSTPRIPMRQGTT